MKLGRILNKKLNTAIADMGHGDILIICDAGFPIPTEEQRIDLAIEKDVPTVEQLLDVISSDFAYERTIISAEMKDYNRPLYDAIERIAFRCPVEAIPYTEFMETMPGKAKYIVRSGAFNPYGNIALVSAIDAPRWWNKPGLVVPDAYKGRV